MKLKHISLSAVLLAAFTVGALASPINYDFSGLLSATDSGGNAYGTFTVDGGTLSAFSFAIEGHYFSNTSLFASGSDGADDAGNPLLQFSYIGAGSQAFNFYLDFGPGGFPGPVNVAAFNQGGFSQQSGLFAIGTFTESPVSIALYSGSVTEAVTTPEPTSLLLLFSGLLLLGGVAWRERRREETAG